MINLISNCRKDATLFTLPLFAICISILGSNASAQDLGGAFPDLPALDFPNLEPRLQEPQAASSSILLPRDLTNDEGLPSEDLLLPDLSNNQNDDFEILTRGALHEAFASAHHADPQASPLVAKTPPELIDEVSPEYKPEGTNVQWIPGYWAWDDAQADFIWISGVWRDVPPGRQWVPGYWSEETGQYRWVSGFWTEQQNQELGYLPAPPTNLDNGPSVQRPSNDHFYVPGNWDYQGENYRWLSGHWQPVVQNYIWVPARYVWTPHGCVYVSGYWDYEVDSRGTCFAPIHFRRPVYVDQSYVYRPSFVVNVNVDFLTHLFVRPNCGQYYYGDWYSSRYSSQGYKPWCNFSSHHRRYDPLLAYYRSRPSSIDLRFNVVQYLAQQHGQCALNRNYRPRTTFSAQLAFVNSSRNRSDHQFAIKNNYVKNFEQLRRQRDQQVRNAQQFANQRARDRARFQRLDRQEQIRIKNSRDAFARAMNERRQLERRNEQNRAQRQAKDQQRQIERNRQNIAQERSRNEANRQARERAERDRNAERQRQAQTRNAREAAERQQRANADRQRNAERQRIAERERQQRENAERQRNARTRQRDTGRPRNEAADRQREMQARIAREAADRQRNSKAQQLRDSVRQRIESAERQRQKQTLASKEIAERQQRTITERQRNAERERQQRQNAERQRKANIERQQKANAERQRQAQARAAKEAAERQQRANVERQRNAERQRIAERERQQRENAERQRRANAERQKRANAERQRQQQQQQERQRQQREQRKKKRK
jgi:hypothetical protein